MPPSARVCGFAEDRIIVELFWGASWLHVEDLGVAFGTPGRLFWFREFFYGVELTVKVWGCILVVSGDFLAKGFVVQAFWARARILIFCGIL